MKLEPAALPSASALLAAPVGTTYVYRRFLLFAPEPVWLVVVKLGPDRWVRAQSGHSLERALAAIGGVPGVDGTTVVDDVDSKAMARRLTKKEIEADGAEEHVGLFMGVLAAGQLPVHEELRRADLETIAVARKAAATAGGKRALQRQLERFTPGKPASAAQLKVLARAIGKLPADLEQVLRWSNGHDELELMSVDELVEVFDDLSGRGELDDLLPLNRNENGDWWGLVLEGPAKGALVYDECNHQDPEQDDVVAPSLLAWFERH